MTRTSLLAKNDGRRRYSAWLSPFYDDFIGARCIPDDLNLASQNYYQYRTHHGNPMNGFAVLNPRYTFSYNERATDRAGARFPNSKVDLVNTPSTLWELPAADVTGTSVGETLHNEGAYQWLSFDTHNYPKLSDLSVTADDSARRYLTRAQLLYPDSIAHTNRLNFDGGELYGASGINDTAATADTWYDTGQMWFSNGNDSTGKYIVATGNNDATFGRYNTNEQSSANLLSALVGNVPTEIENSASGTNSDVNALDHAEFGWLQTAHLSGCFMGEMPKYTAGSNANPYGILYPIESPTGKPFMCLQIGRSNTGNDTKTGYTGSGGSGTTHTATDWKPLIGYDGYLSPQNDGDVFTMRLALGGFESYYSSAVKFGNNGYKIRFQIGFNPTTTTNKGWLVDTTYNSLSALVDFSIHVLTGKIYSIDTDGSETEIGAIPSGVEFGRYQHSELTATPDVDTGVFGSGDVLQISTVNSVTNTLSMPFQYVQDEDRGGSAANILCEASFTETQLWKDLDVTFDWTNSKYYISIDGVSAITSGSASFNTATSGTHTPLTDDMLGFQIQTKGDFTGVSGGDEAYYGFLLIDRVGYGYPLVDHPYLSEATVVDDKYLPSLDEIAISYEVNNASTCTLTIGDDHDGLGKTGYHNAGTASPSADYFANTNNNITNMLTSDTYTHWNLLIFQENIDSPFWRGPIESVRINQPTTHAKTIQIRAADSLTLMSQQLPTWEMGQGNTGDATGQTQVHYRNDESSAKKGLYYMGTNSFEPANNNLGITESDQLQGFSATSDSRMRLNSAHPIQLYNNEDSRGPNSAEDDWGGSRTTIGPYLWDGTNLYVNIYDRPINSFTFDSTTYNYDTKVKANLAVDETDAFTGVADGLKDTYIKSLNVYDPSGLGIDGGLGDDDIVKIVRYDKWISKKQGNNSVAGPAGFSPILHSPINPTDGTLFFANSPTFNMDATGTGLLGCAAAGSTSTTHKTGDSINWTAKASLTLFGATTNTLSVKGISHALSTSKFLVAGDVYDVLKLSESDGTAFNSSAWTNAPYEFREAALCATLASRFATASDNCCQVRLVGDWTTKITASEVIGIFDGATSSATGFWRVVNVGATSTIGGVVNTTITINLDFDNCKLLTGQNTSAVSGGANNTSTDLSSGSSGFSISKNIVGRPNSLNRANHARWARDLPLSPWFRMQFGQMTDQHQGIGTLQSAITPASTSIVTDTPYAYTAFKEGTRTFQIGTEVPKAGEALVEPNSLAKDFFVASDASVASGNQGQPFTIAKTQLKFFKRKWNGTTTIHAKYITPDFTFVADDANTTEDETDDAIASISLLHPDGHGDEGEYVGPTGSGLNITIPGLSSGVSAGLTGVNVFSKREGHTTERLHEFRLERGFTEQAYTNSIYFSGVHIRTAGSGYAIGDLIVDSATSGQNFLAAIDGVTAAGAITSVTVGRPWSGGVTASPSLSITTSGGSSGVVVLQLQTVGAQGDTTLSTQRTISRYLLKVRDGNAWRYLSYKELLQDSSGVAQAHSTIYPLGANGGGVEMFDVDAGFLTEGRYTFPSIHTGNSTLTTTANGSFLRKDWGTTHIAPDGTTKQTKITGITHKDSYKHLWVLWADMRNDGTADADNGTRRSDFGLLYPTSSNYKISLVWADQNLNPDYERGKFAEMAIGTDCDIWKLDATDEPFTGGDWSAMTKAIGGKGAGSDSDTVSEGFDQIHLSDWDSKSGAFIVIDCSKFFNLNTRGNNGSVGQKVGGSTDLGDFVVGTEGFPVLLDNYWEQAPGSYLNNCMSAHPNERYLINNVTSVTSNIEVGTRTIQLADASKFDDGGIADNPTNYTDTAFTPEYRGYGQIHYTESDIRKAALFHWTGKKQDMTIGTIVGVPVGSDNYQVTVVTDTNHYLEAGMEITISGTTNYNGTFNVSSVDEGSDGMSTYWMFSYTANTLPAHATETSGTISVPNALDIDWLQFYDTTDPDAGNGFWSGVSYDYTITTSGKYLLDHDISNNLVSLAAQTNASLTSPAVIGAQVPIRITDDTTTTSSGSSSAMKDVVAYSGLAPIFAMRLLMQIDGDFKSANSGSFYESDKMRMMFSDNLLYNWFQQATLPLHFDIASVPKTANMDTTMKGITVNKSTIQPGITGYFTVYSVSGGTGVTITMANHGFTTSDIGKTVVIVGSGVTNLDGSFPIAAVPSVNTFTVTTTSTVTGTSTGSNVGRYYLQTMGDDFGSVVNATNSTMFDVITRTRESAGVGDTNGGLVPFSYMVDTENRLVFRPKYNTGLAFAANIVDTPHDDTGHVVYPGNLISSNSQLAPVQQYSHVRVIYNEGNSFVDYPSSGLEVNEINKRNRLRWKIVQQLKISTSGEALAIAKQEYEKVRKSPLSVTAQIAKYTHTAPLTKKSAVMQYNARKGYIVDTTRRITHSRYPQFWMGQYGSPFPGTCRVVDGNPFGAGSDTRGSSSDNFDFERNYYWYGTNSVANAVQVVHIPHGLRTTSETTGNKLRVIIRPSLKQSTSGDFDKAPFDIFLADPTFTTTAGTGGLAPTLKATFASINMLSHVEVTHNGLVEIPIPVSYDSEISTAARIILSVDMDYIRACARYKGVTNENAHDLSDTDGSNIWTATYGSVSASANSPFPLGVRQFSTLYPGLTTDRDWWYAPRLHIDDNAQNFQPGTIVSYTDPRLGLSATEMVIQRLSWRIKNNAPEELVFNLERDENRVMGGIRSWVMGDEGLGGRNGGLASARVAVNKTTPGGWDASHRSPGSQKFTDVPISKGEGLQDQATEAGYGGSGLGEGMGVSSMAAETVRSMRNNNLSDTANSFGIPGSSKPAAPNITIDGILTTSTTAMTGNTVVNDSGFSFPGGGGVTDDTTLPVAHSRVKVIAKVPSGLASNYVHVKANINLNSGGLLASTQKALLKTTVRCLEDKTNTGQPMSHTSKTVISMDTVNHNFTLFAGNVQSAKKSGNTIEVIIERFAGSDIDDAALCSVDVKGLSVGVARSSNQGEDKTKQYTFR